MLFAKIFIAIVSLLTWVLGAKASTQCTYGTKMTDFLFALPVIPMLFKTPDSSTSPAMYVVLGICYGLSISGLIILLSF